MFVMKIFRLRGFLLFLFLLLVVGLFPAQTFAVGPIPCSWIGANFIEWSASTTNWSCGAIPNDNTYDVTICGSGISSIYEYTQNITVGRLTIGDFGGGANACGTARQDLYLDGSNLIIDDAQGWEGAGDLRFGSNGYLEDYSFDSISLDGDLEGNMGASGVAPVFFKIMVP